MIGGGALGSVALGGLAGGARTLVAMRSPRVNHYTAVLTGSQNSLPDLPLPISSFGAQLRSGTNSYLSVVVPGIDLASAIFDRNLGRIKVTHVARYADGGSDSITFAEVPLNEVRIDEGAVNKSLTLSGSRITVNDEPATIPISGVNYHAVQGGAAVYRIAPDHNIRPGDSCTYGIDNFSVGSIAISISAQSVFMELRE